MTTRTFKKALYLSAALLLSILPAKAAETIKIGVLNDQSGVFADNGGTGSVAAAKLAAEDFGGELLGRKIEVISADHQNKPDIAAATARRWFDTEGVDVIADGAASSAGFAILEVARQKNKIFVISGPGSSDFTGKACSPVSFHFNYDTYALSKMTSDAVTKAGGNTWYFITADYAFGHALQRDATKFIEAAGGKVVGSSAHPLGSTDMASFLLQAQASKAKVVGLATSGADVQTAIKQAGEFGIVESGQQLAGLLVFITDVNALGLKATRGLQVTTSFYWDLNDDTRAWAKRYFAATGGKVPSMVQAGVYSGVHHYLAAVKAAGTKDPAIVAKKMHEMKVNDMYNKDVAVRPDGRVLHTMYLVQVKKPEESKYKYDYYKVLTTAPGEQAFRPMSEGNCPLVQN
ncbi:ABC transporter substrate-binding protein [Rhodopseudomonas sp. BR0M22]|uniref:ABC transporter substrate-binding protein n=1 Tax=Rhodopseudomonas sp. BR0M22 TaxID=2269369 RepID=UPI0013DEC57F|nr:ABC transporter substrate-binding protein [Rhodopseudomonas sp. BR0M22]NEW94583.1 ABC transporter permease [Rhodopseudomonas sp. BR0M22]